MSAHLIYVLYNDADEPEAVITDLDEVDAIDAGKISVADNVRLVRYMAAPLRGPDTMDFGWNQPAPATKAEMIEVLEDVLGAVRDDDSFEGFLQWSMPIDDPATEERARADKRWADAEFGLMARYRIGNSMGQGGLRVFTKPRDPSSES
jgi:hypothetical protein